MVPKMALIWGNGGLNVRFYDHEPEKAHPCAEPRVLAYFGIFCVKIDLGALVVASCKNPPKNGKKKNEKKLAELFGAQSHACA